MARKKLLIIKHGFSETCDHRVSPVVSLGDVFRCTCLLEDFRAYEVTWITAVAAADLLLGNHLIDKLILADSSEDLPAEGVGERFHTIINLEKQEDWCRFAVSLDAKRRYGFRDWTGGCRSGLYHLSGSALSGTLDNENYQPVQTTLFSIVGKEWAGQRYVLGYRPKVAEVYDVGLNYHIGPKWPTKAWSQDKWQQLYRQLSQDRAVAWQQSLNSIRHYIDWLASCRLIVTCDSLGLHLALGLKKKVVALFGPTAPEQIYMYGQGLKLTGNCQRNCLPCYEPGCTFDESCMDSISVDMVGEAINMLLADHDAAEEIQGAKQPVIPFSSL